NFYTNRSILITGATGFLGKALIDKILRSCPDVEKLYLLVRAKKGKNVLERVDTLFEDPVFDQLKLDMPNYRHKIIGINGDCSIVGLGLNEKDRKMICSKVSICIHSAATVRFDEEMKEAVAINVQGTKEIILLCKEMLNIQALVHVSTAYANCHRTEIDEKTYPPTISSENLMKLCECLDSSTLNCFTPSLLKKFPNTYAFTKSVAEDVVEKYAKGLPVAIFRPAIVISSAKEPICGWIDNMYGPTGIVVGVGAGLIRTMHMDRQVAANVVPVDMCVNAILACAWDMGMNRYDEVPVYNYVSSTRNRMTWGTYMDYYQIYGRMKPSSRAVWYYALNDTKYHFLFWIYTLFMHILPAALIDSLFVLIGKQPKLLAAYRKIHKFVGVIAYFSTREWKFNDQNVVNLWCKLSLQDKEEFYFNIENLDWQQYIKSSIDGIRLFLFKDDPSTIPTAIKKMQRYLLFIYIIIPLYLRLINKFI
ncbi:fatty acyl-CoA reductase wat-like, partial [Ctenocephalides felis]|uniref:fatty acyl-CoA reductase wat-like n=1 Tax=Ctenocephalides felis TaxID=7515 RepID=UPI000E6E47E8